jgi:hypothetical protein
MSRIDLHYKDIMSIAIAAARDADVPAGQER